MKRALITLLTLLIFVAAAIPAIAQDRRRHRSRFGRKARTVAIVGGGALAGGLIGGGKGAAIGAGGPGLYAMNRPAAKRHFKTRTRRIGTVASGTALGAGVGGAVGGKRSAAIGAAAGAGTSYLYTRKARSYRRHRRY